MGRVGLGLSVLGMFRGLWKWGFSVELLHTTVHVGQKRLLTDWCLVTMMVGMGELSAWPLSEPRI